MYKILQSLKTNCNELSILIITEYCLDERPHQDKFAHVIQQLPWSLIQIVHSIVILYLNIINTKENMGLISNKHIEVLFIC